MTSPPPTRNNELAGTFSRREFHARRSERRKSAKRRDFPFFVDLRTDVDVILSEFHQILKRDFLEVIQIFRDNHLRNFQSFRFVCQNSYKFNRRSMYVTPRISRARENKEPCGYATAALGISTGSSSRRWISARRKTRSTW